MQSIIEARQWEDWFRDLGFPSKLTTQEKFQSMNSVISGSIHLKDTFDLRDWEKTFAQYKFGNKVFHNEYQGNGGLKLRVDGKFNGIISYLAGSTLITKSGEFHNLSNFFGREVLQLEVNHDSFEVMKEW